METKSTEEPNDCENNQHRPKSSLETEAHATEKEENDNDRKKESHISSIQRLGVSGQVCPFTGDGLLTIKA